MATCAHLQMSYLIVSTVSSRENSRIALPPYVYRYSMRLYMVYALVKRLNIEPSRMCQNGTCADIQNSSKKCIKVKIGFDAARRNREIAFRERV